MTDAATNDPATERRLWNRRIIQIGAVVALASVLTGVGLGYRSRLVDLFFAGWLCSLLVYYSGWAQRRRRARAVALSAGMVCVVAALIAEFTSATWACTGSAAG